MNCLAFLIPVVLCAAVIFRIGFGGGNISSDSWGNSGGSASGVEEEPEAESEPPETEGRVQGAEAVDVADGFIFISGGTFTMGSPESEAWRSGDEQQHTVTVSDFYISLYEVTQAEYEVLTGTNPSSFEGGNLPVDSVSP